MLIIPSSLWLINFLIIVFISGEYAQNNDDYSTKLTPQLYDTLAYEGIYENRDESIWDVAGYDRLYKLDVPFGKYKSYDISIPGEVKKRIRMPEYTELTEAIFLLRMKSEKYSQIIMFIM